MMRLAAIAYASILAITSVFAAELPKPLTDEDFRSYQETQVRLGQLLFYDRILSGTYRVSCATCHNHDRASSNGVRLDGKEEERDELAVGGEPVYEPFKPSAKHAPALFNLGAKQFTSLFFDGRVRRLSDGSFRSPAGDELPEGLTDVLAVQALFPAVQGDELAGTVENDLTAVAHKGSKAVWDVLAARVRDIDGYWPLFKAAYPEIESVDDIAMVHIANAIGAFVGTEWRSDDAPFDRYLQGDVTALDARQKRGMKLFYGAAKCSTCHSGALQTDHKIHDGRRTPSLRNIERSPPYGGEGGFETLESFLKHHRGGTQQIGDIVAFLESLTDENGLRGKLGKPDQVPSSLALD